MTDSATPPLAILTGAGGGIGRAIALRLAELGYELILVDLDEATAEGTAQQCEYHGVPTRVIVGDVSREAFWAELANSLGETRGAQLLVNAAGVLLVGLLTDCSVEEMRRVLEINLLGTMIGCRTLTPKLCSHPKARLPPGIMNLASVFAVVTPPRFAAYNASKGGVVSFSETLRHELALKNLNVTTVLPGAVKTELFERASYAGQEPTETQGLKRSLVRYISRTDLTPERVAAKAVAAYGRSQAVVTVGRRASLYSWGMRLAPSLVRRLVARRTARELE